MLTRACTHLLCPFSDLEELLQKMSPNGFLRKRDLANGFFSGSCFCRGNGQEIVAAATAGAIRRIRPAISSNESPAVGNLSCGICCRPCGPGNLKCEDCPTETHRNCLGLTAGAYTGGWFLSPSCVFAAAQGGTTTASCSTRLAELACS
ncbi:hypothetical protein VaNZ11_011571 [Volvox africanus]|uniref:Zinc finger PHD-type domain-containing protein n=1 Tax=Volvox africanus TaxID=51714 RepID=A0ABQ5SD68_9CHLO|nr:hypothetical protein VaNZ11_011571 [Volvox africanus]